MQANDADRAEAAYRALLEADAADIHGLIGLGFVSRLRGEREAARLLFENAAQVYPRHTWPLLEISAEWSALGKPEAAAASLRRALELDPRDYHCLIGLGRLLRSQAMHDAAAGMFRRAALHHPSEPSAYMELAADLADAQRYDEAASVLDSGIDAGASGALLLAGRARLLQAAGQPEAGLASWRAALACEPVGAALRLEIAAAFAALGALDSSLEEYRAIAGDADIDAVHRANAGLAASRLARRLNDTSLAAGILEQTASAVPDHVGIVTELADFYRATNRPRDAERAYRRVLEFSENSLSALGGLAIVRRQLGDAEGAVALLSRARTADPGNDWIRFEWATSLLGVGRTDEAGAALEVIQPSVTMYAWARMSLGHMARARGDRHWAACYFEQAAQHSADPTDALCQAAAECRAVGDLAGAGAAIDRIFQHAPNSWRGHLASGYLQRAAGNHAEAAAAFRRAVAANPSQAQPYVELAADCLERWQHREAKAAIDAALFIEPRHEAALLKKATLLAAAGETEAALSLYAELRAERPSSVWAYVASARLLADNADIDAAMAILQEAEAACPVTPDAGLCRADIMRRVGMLDEAYAVAAALHARFDQALTPWCHFVSLSIELGQFDTAGDLLAAAPHAAGSDAARIMKLQSQLAAARWDLPAAITALDRAISAGGLDTQTVYERAKLKLITFDLEGAREGLTAHTRLGCGRHRNRSQTHVGQIYDEFVLDAEVSRAATAVRESPACAQVEFFAKLVSRCPGSTAAATGLMIALRRDGRFDRPNTKQGRDAQAGIPRLIAQFWNEPEPPADIGRLMTSWRLFHPDFQIDIFNDRTAVAYLRARCGDIVARAFVAAAEAAQRADLFRLGRLLVEGGYYIDADDRARSGLSGACPEGASFFAHQEDLGSIGNNVIGATPGHPVIETALRDAVTAILRGDRDIVWLSTGPGLLTRSLARWLAAEGAVDDARLAAVSVLTLSGMRRVAAMHCHAAYKNSDRAWLNAAFPKRAGQVK